MARPLRPAEAPGVSTLNDALWDRVGRLLVASGRLTRAELDDALVEHFCAGIPLDEILIERGHVSRRGIASIVLVAQLGDTWKAKLREQAPREAPTPSGGAQRGRAPLPDLPAGPRRAFTRACLAVDVSMLTLAALLAALARRNSDVPLPPAVWMAAFAALTVLLYWSWRLSTYRRELRPIADSLSIAGATSLAAMAVLAIRSLAGASGVAEELLPLWAFTTVYGVAGRLGFYLAWTARASVQSPAPAAAPEAAGFEQPESSPGPRRTEVVPLRPELWGVLDELRREVDALVRESPEAGRGGQSAA
jgi:hypothetical protein